ncbi:hypothetical protein HGI15_00890 [Modestobacter lapidis]|nr:hypothetical protein [Modestobacter lapidis]
MITRPADRRAQEEAGPMDAPSDSDAHVPGQGHRALRPSEAGRGAGRRLIPASTG